MSWQAAAYVKELSRCPDGAPISCGQKLLALVLADYHNSHRNAAWPSVPTLAQESLCSLRQAQRYLAYLEEHGVIRKIAPEKSGRGFGYSYQFTALDSAEGSHGDTLSIPRRVSEGCQKGDILTPEGCQKGDKSGNAIRKNIELRTTELRTCEICQGKKEYFNFQAKTPKDRRFLPCPNCCDQVKALGASA